MKLITRDTDYAVRAISFIADKKGELVSADSLVRKLKIPRSFLRKILQILGKKGILRSYKGKGGGFVLALAPGKIYLVDLMKIFQGPVSLNECVFKKQICPDRKKCPLRKKITTIEGRVLSELSSITIASLAR